MASMTDNGMNGIMTLNKITEITQTMASIKDNGMNGTE